MPSDSDGPSRPSHAAAAEAGSDQQSRPPALLAWMRNLLRLGAIPSIRADLAEALAADPDEGDFSSEERTLLTNILNLKALRVSDVMISRPDIIAASEDITLAALLRLLRSAEHSRVPVYHETLDETRGVVHIKDVLALLMQRAGADDNGEGPLDLSRIDLDMRLADTDLVRPVLYAPGGMRALDLLSTMQAGRMHLALVIDEYGGTEGLVTIEDLVETIVGDIEDEHDHDEAVMITAAPDGSFVADARTSIEDAVAAIGTDLATGRAYEEIATLGGLVVTLAGRVPATGEVIADGADLLFEVLEADPRRIKRLRVMRVSAEPRRLLRRRPEAAHEGGAAGRLAADRTGQDEFPRRIGGAEG